MKKEFRSFVDAKCSLETREDGTTKITGYAAVFDSDSVDFGFFTEVVRSGAFARTLRENTDIRALLDHDTGKIIARTKAGNLELREDAKGLLVEFTPIETDDGKKAIEWVRSGVVDGMSFGFVTREDKWGTKNGKAYRELLDVDLAEISLVAFPAYPATSASIRSAEEVWRECQSKVTPAPKLVDSAKRRLVLYEIGCTK